MLPVLAPVLPGVPLLLAGSGCDAQRDTVTLRVLAGVLKDREGYAMRMKKPGSKKKPAGGGGKSGKRVPFTEAEDKELIRWCLAHGDSRPAFDKAVEAGVCATHDSAESLRGRCRNYAMKNVALVAQVEREIERENKASAASPGKKAVDEPFTQAQSESENDDDYDDFAADEARQEEERKARAGHKQARKQPAKPSPPRPPTAHAQAALAAARAESQQWEAVASESGPAARITGRRKSAGQPVAGDDNDDDLVGQLLSNSDQGQVRQERGHRAGDREYGSDDDLVDSLLNESTGVAAAGATAAVTTPLKGHSRKRGDPSVQLAAASTAPVSAASSRKKPRGTPAGRSPAAAASTGTSARDVIDLLSTKAQCSPAVAVHALLVCTGMPAHAYAYLIGKNDGNLPKGVHVWTCEEDKVMQAVSSKLLLSSVARYGSSFHCTCTSAHAGEPRVARVPRGDAADKCQRLRGADEVDEVG